MFQTSGAVARELRVRYPVLFGLIQDGRLDPAPLKDSTGRYLWTAEDIDRARRVLESRRQRATPAVAV